VQFAWREEVFSDCLDLGIRYSPDYRNAIDEFHDAQGFHRPIVGQTVD
jgi:hypothetical protein